MQRHIHRYIRVKIGKAKRPELKCSFLGCVHHIPPQLANGRESVCNYCGKIFHLTPARMRLAKPHCGCISKKDPITEDIAKILQETE